MESIKKRTSIRKYADKEVTDELLNQLLEEAMRTRGQSSRHSARQYITTMR